jgi:chromosomal replication initiation ATPase DnaA
MMETGNANIWEQILDRVRHEVEPDEFRRWFSDTGFASDSGDQITVWVTSEALRRHVERNYHDVLTRILEGMDRRGATIRFAVAGIGDEDEDGEDL